MIRRFHRALFGTCLLGAMSLGSSGCAAPMQQGEVIVAPGASERFMLAMSMGYLGNFDREMVPGQVRRALLEDQLPDGKARSARVGDYVLENGHVLAAITNVDGTSRGGRLVDLARKPGSTDGLGRLEHDVLGRHLVYDSLKTGKDEATNAAYVEVSGRVDLTAADAPPGSGALLTVSTRYDAAPGIEAIVVHTHVKLDRGSLADVAPELDLLDERLVAEGAGEPLLDAVAGAGAAMGKEGAYMLRPLFDGASLTVDAGAPRMRINVSAAPTEGDSIVITRVVTPLERPDSGALAVAVAKTEGRGIGDVEVRVAPKSRGAGFPNRGDLAFVGANGARFDVCNIDTSGEDSHFPATMPAGKYTVHFLNKDLQTEPVSIEIEENRVAFLTLFATSRSSSAPVEPARCPTAR